MSDNREWLEADGLGGFSSGTADLVRTRRYHGLLLAAARPPADRWMLVNGLEAWLDLPDGESVALSSHRYRGGVIYPDGRDRISHFTTDPWPTWTFDVGSASVVFELLTLKDEATTVLSWGVLRTDDSAEASRSPARGQLRVRLLCSGRDPHHLQTESEAYRFGLSVEGQHLELRGYPDTPAIHAWTNAAYRHDPVWFRQFEYEGELARGLDGHEDLASSGEFSFAMAEGPAVIVLSTRAEAVRPDDHKLEIQYQVLQASERSRRNHRSEPLARAAEAYVVRRNEGHTVIAGYPWFGDWGRDTFIALRGLRHLPEGQELAESILLQWSSVVSEGMVPNRFPDRGDAPEYNSVDASLWYVMAVKDHLLGAEPGREVRQRLWRAVEQILDGYQRGTRYGIAADEDGLLRAGEPGIQLTWMDAKVGDWVVTPRIGKPVEIQALWLSALEFSARQRPDLVPILERGRLNFAEKFYDGDKGILRDVVDVDHVSGRVDARLRPNQIFALGALGAPLIALDKALAVMERVEVALWTDQGLRSLAPHEEGYVPRYEGGVRERDGAYHQGTVWPWLVGPFVDAWVTVRGGSVEVQHQARARFLDPVLAHLDKAGIGHVSEIADAEAPYHPRGAPFQAWSVTELLRLDRTLAD